MTLNKNTIPKINIKVIDLKSEFDIKNYFFDQKYLKKRKIYWKNSTLELIGIDHLLSSDFSTKEEYQSLTTYYREIVKINQYKLNELDAPFIFMGSAFNLNEETKSDIWNDFPKGNIFIPKILVISNNNFQKVMQFSFEGEEQFEKLDNSNIKTYASDTIKIKNINDDNYKNKVNKAIQLINKNQLSKIVLSRKKSYSIKSKEKLLFNFIYQQSIESNTTNFIIDFQDSGTILGSSPETLFKISGKQLNTEALAGSFKSDLDVDLIQNKKEVDEHNFVIEHLKKQLAKFSDSIKINDNEIIKLHKISHIKTKLESRINEAHDVFDIIYHIHPTPAVAGTPKNISIEKIAEIESHNRGWYAGFLGWIDHRLDAHFIVNIRSGIIKKDLLSIYAGCGITKDSNAQEEYNESEMKFDYILSKLNNE